MYLTFIDGEDHHLINSDKIRSLLIDTNFLMVTLDNGEVREYHEVVAVEWEDKPLFHFCNITMNMENQ